MNTRKKADIRNVLDGLYEKARARGKGEMGHNMDKEVIAEPGHIVSKGKAPDIDSALGEIEKILDSE